MQLTKSATLVEDYDFVWSGDAALDKDADGFMDDYRNYVQTGDETHLRVMTGQEPVRWRLCHLRGRVRRQLTDAAQATKVGDQSLSTEAVWEACALALVSVVGLRNADGTVADVDRVSIRGCKRVTDEDMANIDEAFPGIVESIGYLAISKLNPDPKS